MCTLNEPCIVWEYVKIAIVANTTKRARRCGLSPKLAFSHLFPAYVDILTELGRDRCRLALV